MRKKRRSVLAFVFVVVAIGLPVGRASADCPHDDIDLCPVFEVAEWAQNRPATWQQNALDLGQATVDMDLAGAAAQHSIDVATAPVNNAVAIAAAQGQFVCHADFDAYHGEPMRQADGPNGTGVVVAARDIAAIVVHCSSATVPTYQITIDAYFQYWTGSQWANVGDDGRGPGHVRCDWPGNLGVGVVVCPITKEYAYNSPYLNKVHRAWFVMSFPYSQSWPSYEFLPVLKLAA